MKHFLHTLALLPLVSFSAHAAQVQVQTQAPAQKYNTNILLAVAAGSFFLSFKALQSFNTLKQAKYAELAAKQTHFRNLDPARKWQKLQESSPASYQRLSKLSALFALAFITSGTSLATWFYLKFKNRTITTS